MVPWADLIRAVGLPPLGAPLEPAQGDPRVGPSGAAPELPVDRNAEPTLSDGIRAVLGRVPRRGDRVFVW
ncbi:MAG: hypothetical protein ACI8PT_002574 [Gammaproteobacteria bacterium]|jgi:hypothetical protein